MRTRAIGEVLYNFVSAYMKTGLSVILLYVVNSIKPLSKTTSMILAAIIFYWILYPYLKWIFLDDKEEVEE